MKAEDLADIRGQLLMESGKLLLNKSKDYANEDVLANFKRMSYLAGTLGIYPHVSPADCALFLALLKVDRWTNLRRKGASPKNESVKDTVMDLLNYVELAYCCDVEITKEVPK